MTNIKDVTDASFKAEVLESDLPTLVDFWATWCPPCKALTPVIEALANEYKGRFKMVKIDSDDNQLTSVKYGVKALPTLLIFRNGNVVAQIVGALPKAKLEAELKKHLG